MPRRVATPGNLRVVPCHSFFFGLGTTGSLPAFTVHHPPRRVNSLYYDTHELGCLGDNLAGVASRSKLRLRWYGTALENIEAALEVKCKQGRLGWKHQHTLAHRFDLDAESWRELSRKIERDLPDWWARRVEVTSRPVVIVSYQREYYRTADHDIRATLDFDLTAYDQQRGIKPNLQRRVPMRDRVVLELKCDSAVDGRLADVVSALPIRVEKCSKYVQSALAARSS